MMFCPKCGSLLKPKSDKKKKVLACSCGFVNKDLENAKIKEEVKKEEKNMGVVDENATHLPEIEAKCPECGHDRAVFWTQQMRASDEPETKFMKCKKCKHTWRDQS